MNELTITKTSFNATGKHHNNMAKDAMHIYKAEKKKFEAKLQREKQQLKNHRDAATTLTEELWQLEELMEVKRTKARIQRWNEIDNTFNELCDKEERTEKYIATLEKDMKKKLDGLQKEIDFNLKMAGMNTTTTTTTKKLQTADRKEIEKPANKKVVQNSEHMREDTKKTTKFIVVGENKIHFINGVLTVSPATQKDMKHVNVAQDTQEEKIDTLGIEPTQENIEEIQEEIQELEELKENILNQKYNSEESWIDASADNSYMIHEANTEIEEKKALIAALKKVKKTKKKKIVTPEKKKTTYNNFDDLLQDFKARPKPKVKLERLEHWEKQNAQYEMQCIIDTACMNRRQTMNIGGHIDHQNAIEVIEQYKGTTAENTKQYRTLSAWIALYNIATA